MATVKLCMCIQLCPYGKVALVSLTISSLLILGFRFAHIIQPPRAHLNGSNQTWEPSYPGLLLFSVLATYKVTSVQVPTCDGAHSWRPYSAAL